MRVRVRVRVRVSTRRAQRCRYDGRGGCPLRLWREAHRLQRARLVGVRGSEGSG